MCVSVCVCMCKGSEYIHSPPHTCAYVYVYVYVYVCVCVCVCMCVRVERAILPPIFKVTMVPNSLSFTYVCA